MNVFFLLLHQYLMFGPLRCRTTLLSYLLCNDDKLVMASLCLSVSFLQNEGESVTPFLKLWHLENHGHVIDDFGVLLGQLWMNHY